MASPSSTTTAEFIFKTKQKGLEDEANRRHPTLDGIVKQGGLAYKDEYDVLYGDGQGGGAVFATAQANVSPVKGEKFQMLPKTQYRIAQIDNVSSELGKGDENSYEELVVAEVRGTLNGLLNDAGMFLFRNGSGARGRIATGGISGNVVTLDVAADARFFFIGMTVSAGVSTSSLRSGTTTVAAVDTDAGTVTLTSVAAITALAAADYLFREGDTGNVCMEGFESIIPLTAPVYLSDSFRGVDRGKYVTLLAGVRVAADGSLPEEMALRVATKIHNNGGVSDEVVMDPITALDVCNRGGAKIVYDTNKNDIMEFGFTGARLRSPAGVLKIVSDPDCPSNRLYVRKASSWRIQFAGPKFVHHTLNGVVSSKFWRDMESADRIEGRWRIIANLKCLSPRDNGVGEVAA